MMVHLKIAFLLFLRDWDGWGTGQLGLSTGVTPRGFLCGLGFLTAWQLDSKHTHPKRARQKCMECLQFSFGSFIVLLLFYLLGRRGDSSTTVCGTHDIIPDIFGNTICHTRSALKVLLTHATHVEKELKRDFTKSQTFRNIMRQTVNEVKNLLCQTEVDRTRDSD